MLKAKDKNGFLVYIDNADRHQQYYCQICDQPVMQKRGEIRIHHFSHYSPHGSHANIVPCSDLWSYDMSDWHMDWQKRFSSDDIEKVLKIGKEKHIADLLIDNIVVEFQHSPISLEDFNERNSFYFNCGYKVIWVFDLIEDMDNGRIRFGDYEGCYKWAYVKKIFKSLDLGDTKATIYFQFNDCDDDCGVLERVISLRDEGKQFKTDSRYSLSIKEFVEMVKNNDANLFGRPKPLPNPEKIDGCSTVEELWKNSYSKMLIKNAFNKNVVFVYGKNGELIRDYQTNKIRCSYAYLDKYDGFYKSKNEFYNVFDEDKKIWQLIKAFKDKNFEKREQEVKEIKKVEASNEGYNSIDEIVRNNTKFILIVENIFTHKRYYLKFTDDFRLNKSSFNIYEIDKENKVIKFDNALNEELSKLYKYRLWQVIPLVNIYDLKITPKK